MSTPPEITIVIPTIREAHINAFLDAWRWPETARVIVVEDNPERSFQLPARVEHYAWSDIDRDLGVDGWIIPRRTDCVRSYGYWKAYQTGAPHILTLDDDCLPHNGMTAEGFIAQHLANLEPQRLHRWHNTLASAERHPRGYPYEATASDQDIGISHGLWSGVLDYDAPTQLTQGRVRPAFPPDRYVGLIPRGQYYPMCGMNLAWRREYTPLLYFLLMGQDAQGNRYPFDRFGDIWAGIIAKKILDHLGVGVYSGNPVVHHARASNVWANLRKEAPGLEVNETLWRHVDAVPLEGRDIPWLYSQVASAIRTWGGDYWPRLGRAMAIWGGLYV